MSKRTSKMGAQHTRSTRRPRWRRRRRSARSSASRARRWSPPWRARSGSPRRRPRPSACAAAVACSTWVRVTKNTSHCGSTMERSGMGCSSLICRALAGAAWSPSKVPINPSILDRIPPAHPRSKTIEKIIAFAICLLNKIDATRFSGPEQFLLARPIFSSRNRTLCRCLDRSRCFFFSEQHILSVYSTSI